MRNPLAEVVNARIAELGVSRAEITRRMGFGDQTGRLSAWLKEGTDEAMPMDHVHALASALGFDLDSPGYLRVEDAARSLKVIVNLEEKVFTPLLKERDELRAAFLEVVGVLAKPGRKLPEATAQLAERIRKLSGG